MLVERHQRAEGERGQLVEQDQRRGSIPGEGAKRNLVGRDSRGRHLLGGSAECQCLGLSNQVRRQQVMARSMLAHRLQDADEIHRYQPGPLVKELVERVLTVGAGLAPDDWPRVSAHRTTVSGHPLAIRLHLELLKIGRKPTEVGGVGHHAEALSTQES